jgi:uncharacterized protein (DUF305 family)
MTDAVETRTPRSRLVLAAIISGILVLAAGVLIGVLATPSPAIPSTTSAEAGFARDMQVHHGQAVEMSRIVYDLTDDAEVRLLAQDIMLTQQGEAGRMYGWLEAWGLPQASSEPAMTWMSRPTLEGGSHEDMGMESDSSHSPGDPMPGYASDEDMAKLATLSGEEAEIFYLQLMIEHHQGGVEMAEALLARSDNPVVTPLAQSIVTFQSSGIVDMTAMLEARGAAPLP